MRSIRRGSGGVIVLLLLLIFLSSGLQPLLATLLWFLHAVSPYILGAVGLFLAVVIVLRLLNAWNR